MLEADNTIQYSYSMCRKGGQRGRHCRFFRALAVEAQTSSLELVFIPILQVLLPVTPLRKLASISRPYPRPYLADFSLSQYRIPAVSRYEWETPHWI